MYTHICTVVIIMWVFKCPWNVYFFPVDDNGGDSTLIIIIVVVIIVLIALIGLTIFIICCIKYDKCPCIRRDDCPCFSKGK